MYTAPTNVPGSASFEAKIKNQKPKKRSCAIVSQDLPISDIIKKYSESILEQPKSKTNGTCTSLHARVFEQKTRNPKQYVILQ